MPSNDYTYGDSRAVHERLMCSQDVTREDLIGAMANAMKRIADLEDVIKEAKRESKAAAGRIS